MNASAPPHSRRGRRHKHAVRAQSNAISKPYIIRNIPLTELCSVEGLEIIEANADTILQEIGIEFKDDDEILALWRNAGADIDGTRVRFAKGLLRELLKTAPATFTQHARNPARNVEMGGKNLVIAPVYGPPFVRDLDGERRYGTIEDFHNFVKLTYMAPSLHHSGGTVCEPVDLPVNKRHFDMVYAHMRYSDKPFMGAVTHPDRAADTVAMCEILFGKTFTDENTVCTSLINCNSPMTMDGTMLGSLKTYARANQAVVVTPFIMQGAMSPVSVVGTLAQALAEAMAGMAVSQLVRPGAPVIFGMFSAALSMKTGAPTFGTPEPTLVISAAAQLARRLNLPFRSGGALCGSKIPDAQAAYESANSLLPSVLSGVNFMLHGAGWLEGGLVSSYEKFVMDIDQLGMMETLCQGYDFSENGQAMDAVRDVGPGNHYLGCEHTLKNFKTAFYSSTIADNNSFEQWQAEGALDSRDRAKARCKDMLDAYQAPPIEPAVDEALLDFIAEKKESFPDSNI